MKEQFRKTESGLFIPIEVPVEPEWSAEDFLKRYEPRFIMALRDYFSMCDGCGGEGTDCPKCKGRGLMLEVPEVELNAILTKVFLQIESESNRAVQEAFRDLIKGLFK